MLNCTINPKALQDPKITWLSWTKDGEPLLRYDNANFDQLEAEPGYSLASPSWKDVSLRIANTTLQHEGEYKCEVMVNTAYGVSTSSLKVTGERH